METSSKSFKDIFILHSLAIAGKCKVTFVEPQIALSIKIQSSKACKVIICLAVIFSLTNSTILFHDS